MDQETLRNELCEIEDRARHARKTMCSDDSVILADIVVQLVQLIRQEIVK